MKTLKKYSQEELAERYESVRLLIWSVCHKFHQSYGGDIEEHFAEASTLFMRAVKAYKPDKGGSFPTIVRHHVWGGLLDSVRFAAQRNKRLPRESGECLAYTMDRHHFDLQQFKRSLSKDAALVVHMTCSTWNDIDEACNRWGFGYRSSKESRKRPNGAKVREAIEHELEHTWDWDRARIEEAFKEIEDALQ